MLSSSGRSLGCLAPRLYAAPHRDLCESVSICGSPCRHPVASRLFGRLERSLSWCINSKVSKRFAIRLFPLATARCAPAACSPPPPPRCQAGAQRLQVDFVSQGFSKGSQHHRHRRVVSLPVKAPVDASLQSAPQRVEQHRNPQGG